jgi:hypothetical protein
MGRGVVTEKIHGEKRRLSPMIMQIAKRTVYYPVAKNRASDLLGGSRRVRCFRAAVVVNRKSLK